jgi:hypothetical protein
MTNFFHANAGPNNTDSLHIYYSIDPPHFACIPHSTFPVDTVTVNVNDWAADYYFFGFIQPFELDLFFQGYSAYDYGLASFIYHGVDSFDTYREYPDNNNYWSGHFGAIPGFSGASLMVTSLGNQQNIGYQYWADAITGIENEDPLPERHTAVSAYPNPFNSSTTISYSLTEQSDVSIVVYNILGEEVCTLEQGVKSTGEHSLVFNSSGLTSGLYFAKLETNKESKGVKLLLLK